jgi:hypothetical protein
LLTPACKPLQASSRSMRWEGWLLVPWPTMLMRSESFDERNDGDGRRRELKNWRAFRVPAWCQCTVFWQRLSYTRLHPLNKNKTHGRDAPTMTAQLSTQSALVSTLNLERHSITQSL